MNRAIRSFRDVVAAFPEFSPTIRRAVADGDEDWTHGLVQVAADGPEAVVVDIWRIRDGRLAEHWDVGQAVPDGATAEDLLGP